MKGSAHHRDGFALVAAVLVSIVVLGALVLIAANVQSSARTSGEAVRSVWLDEACKAGVDLAVEQLWNNFWTDGPGNTTGNLASYRSWIDTVTSDGENLDLVTPDQPMPLEGSPAQIDAVRVARADDVTGSRFTITTRVSIRVTPAEVATRTARQVLRVSGEPFRGYMYAVLAKNINCVLCHAEIRSLPLELNTNPDLYNTFDRVKVATLESLLFRPDEADSRIAGTIYTRGGVFNDSGNPMSDSALASSQLKGYGFDQSHGRLTQNASGQMSVTSVRPGAYDAEGRPQQFANFYKNYPSDDRLMTDGPLPSVFPAPFPDHDGDKYVDDDEFTSVADAIGGSITGGVAYGVPEGALYSQSSLPASSNDAAAALAADGKYSGNLVLVGTDANPIVLDGNIAVDGDLLIKGKVKGWGQFLVRGNTYIVGDVTYADAPGQFGRAADGTQNGLSIISGGSILMGDYLTVRGKNHTLDTSKYPDTGLSIRTRERTKSKSVKISGKTQTIRYGYFDPGAVDAGEIAPTMVDSDGRVVTRTGQQFSFTTSELMLFNELEVRKAAQDPNYTPRFYGLRDSQPDSLFVYKKPPDEHSVRYDEAGGGVKALTDYLVESGVPLDVLDRAAFHYMNPSGNWISEDALRQIWWEDEQQRSAAGDPFKFDGLLYSNNAIFQIVRSRSRHGSYTDGRMRIRGAVIAPDLGVLAPGNGSAGEQSFLLHYDPRVQRFWAPEDITLVTAQRIAFSYIPDEEEESGL